MCCLSYKTYNSASLIITLTLLLPFFNLSDWIFFLKLLVLSEAPDTHIALLLKDGILPGAVTPLQSVGLWDPNLKPKEEEPDLQICHNNWSSPNTNPNITRSLIKQEVDNNFVEEIQTLTQQNADGPKVSPWVNLVRYAQTTETLEPVWIPQFVA